MAKVLLNLVVKPAMEAALVEWLLEQESIKGFSSYPVRGHGSSPASLSLAEQVAGTRSQYLYQIVLEQGQSQRLLELLREQFGGSGMHYWVNPVLQEGHLD
ncbi:MAG: DUF3240 domain-containing protein [Gammaproteobacteria bacterium]|nr:MAG: DUF3240 domain-containing protein [Gammaproteobacteria bacterium]